MTEEFYLQDSRAYVGNSIVWWREGCAGYTTDPGKAHVFTRDQAFAHHANRSTDLPWPKEYIDQRAVLHVDSQDVDRGEALERELGSLRSELRHARAKSEAREVDGD